uniref:Uncharacterized protein n=1 Tax=Oryza rufipogon TaxID=4529 RepID=A0A0E0R619_ORYRU
MEDKKHDKKNQKWAKAGSTPGQAVWREEKEGGGAAKVYGRCTVEEASAIAAWPPSAIMRRECRNDSSGHGDLSSLFAGSNDNCPAPPMVASSAPSAMSGHKRETPDGKASDDLTQKEIRKKKRKEKKKNQAAGSWLKSSERVKVSSSSLVGELLAIDSSESMELASD